MALLGISLILVTLIGYCAFHPSAIMETFLAIWRRQPHIQQPPQTKPPAIEIEAERPERDDMKPAEKKVTSLPRQGQRGDMGQSTRNETPSIKTNEDDTPINAPTPQQPESQVESSPVTPKATTTTSVHFAAPPPPSAAAVSRTAATTKSTLSTPSLAPPSAPRPPSLMPPPSLPGSDHPRSLQANPRLSYLFSGRPILDPVQQPGTSTLAPPPTHSSKPARPSRKVILTPGHSPMDWAFLSNNPSTDLRNLPSGKPYLRVTPSMLKRQTGRKGKDAWTALGGKVYNITPYLPFHPGGEPELLRAAGRDGTKLFGQIHPWVNYEGMLQNCLIGVLVSEEEGQRAEEQGGEGGEMDAMD